MSPVPPATSSSRWPGRGASQSIIASFHSRWMPRLISVVHQVVARRRPGEDAVHHAGLLGLGHGLESRNGWCGVSVGHGGLAGPVARPPYKAGGAAADNAAPTPGGADARTARGRDRAPRPEPGDGRAASSLRAEVRRPDLRWPFPPRMAERLTGARVLGAAAAVEIPPRRSRPPARRCSSISACRGGCWSRARMLGAVPPRPPGAGRSTTTSSSTWTAARAITFNDARRFGAMDLMADRDRRGAPAAGAASGPSRWATASTRTIWPRG